MAEYMTTKNNTLILNDEFSREFDVLYNNITSNQAPGLDEYEKSLFLTRALDEVVKAYYTARANTLLEGFDDSERRQIDFSMIIKEESFDSTKFTNSNFSTHSNSKSVPLDDGILMLLNEVVEVERKNSESHTLVVVPIDYTEYSRLMSKPFKFPLKNLAWRLINSSDGRKADIIIGPNDMLTKYNIRYVKRPRAIRLIDFSDEELTIEGESTALCCELDPILYPDIILRACELAKAAYTGDLSSQLALGYGSLTNVGIVTKSA